MPPPPAEPFASRIFLGPALRAQPDRRLVKLVREGYETAFEEIVRRYRKPLDRFAAAFVGARSEDITQDAFSKALLALRGSENEIELRPWLYRIVRNTALNDLRDRPPSAEELNEVALAGGLSAAAEAERREEMAELMERLRALPEPQRAAIVMRELEGLSHEEIAAALGVSGGAARQAIYRARATLRDGFGLLVPLPLLRFLFDHGSEAVGAGGAAAAGAGVAAGGGGAMLGSFGAVGAIKVGVATAVLAGSVGAGVAMQQQDKGGRTDPPPAAAASVLADRGSSSNSGSSGGSSSLARVPASPTTTIAVAVVRARAAMTAGAGVVAAIAARLRTPTTPPTAAAPGGAMALARVPADRDAAAAVRVGSQATTTRAKEPRAGGTRAGALAPPTAADPVDRVTAVAPTTAASQAGATTFPAAAGRVGRTPAMAQAPDPAAAPTTSAEMITGAVVANRRSPALPRHHHRKPPTTAADRVAAALAPAARDRAAAPAAIRPMTIRDL